MAGLNPKLIREALAEQIRSAAITRVVAVYAYAPNGNPDLVTSYPAVLIGHNADGAKYQLTFGPQGLASLALDVEVRTWSADGKSAEVALDDLIAAGTEAGASIFDILNSDSTIGGTVGGISAITCSPPRPVFSSQTEVAYWSATFTITVYSPRS